MLRNWLLILLFVVSCLTFLERGFAQESTLECNKEYSKQCIGVGRIREEDTTPPVCRIWCDIYLTGPSEVDRCPQSCSVHEEITNECKGKYGTLLREFLADNKTPCRAKDKDIELCKQRGENPLRKLTFKCVK